MDDKEVNWMRWEGVAGCQRMCEGGCCYGGWAEVNPTWPSEAGGGD